MGNEESFPNVDANTDVITIKNENLKRIPFTVPPDNEIHAIDLTGNQIESIPDTLKHLISICLSKNGYVKIPKNILDFMVTLSNLQFFDFSGNLIKEIPPQVLQMSKLKKISFLNNKLTEVKNIPNSVEGIELGQNLISSLPTISEKLEILSINYNRIDIIDRDYSNLKKLYINMNQIREIKPNLTFPNLLTLEISKNELKYLPDLSVLAPQLQKIDASVNYIEKFPKLPSTIVEINLTKNNISEIPESIKNLTNLLKLSIEKNIIKNVPVLPPQIQHLLLSLNQITSFSEQSLPNLTQITLSKNRFSSVPAIRDTNLKEYLLFRNWMSDIKVEFISKKITKINLSENRIEAIPDEFFSSLPNLTHLYLAKNQITRFPSTIADSKIVLLSFSQNHIEEFPEKLPNSLHILHCAYCDLKSLPNSIAELPGLKTIDASGNQLKSFIIVDKDSITTNVSEDTHESESESELSSSLFPVLEKLFLSSNSMKEFPSNLPLSLRVLDLSMNKIKVLPDDISKRIPNLIDFSLSYNRLEKLPDEFRFSFVTSLKIDHNPSLTAVLDIPLFRKLKNLDICCTRDVSMKNLNLQDTEKTITEIITSDIKYKNENSSIFKFFYPENIGKFVGYSEMCGQRPSMEDAIVIQPNIVDDIDLYAVLDGHNGGTASNFCSSQIIKYFTEPIQVEPEKTTFFSNFRKAKENQKSSPIEKIPTEKFSEEFCSYICKSLQDSLNEIKSKDGTTLAMVLLKKNEVIISHLGDSRVLLIKQSGEVKYVTLDHKPQNQDEIKRILECGGKIINGRLDGIIAMSRSLGDLDVVGLGRQPAITKITLEEDDRWLVLACDGLFDVMTNLEVGAIASTATSPVELSYFYRNVAHSRHSLDNISVISVDISKRIHE